MDQRQRIAMGWLWDHLFKLRSRREKHGSEFSALLSLDNISYANAVFRVFHEMDPATKAHVIVAYQNLIPMLSALWLAAEKTGERATVEGLIEKLSAEISSYRDEINSRRMTWLLAALLGRLEKLAPNNQTVTSHWRTYLVQFSSRNPEAESPLAKQRCLEGEGERVVRPFEAGP